jgi:hypothetical protein
VRISKAVAGLIMLLGSCTLLQCTDTCECGSWEDGKLVDYSLSEANEQFKVCFQSESFKRDGVFFYTDPAHYRAYDCRKKTELENEIRAVDKSYHTIVYVDNGSLHITHRKTGSFSGRYCGKSSSLSCDFVISYENRYHKNGKTDSVYTIIYPRVTKATVQSYLEKFDEALKEATTNKNFMENPDRMKGFDYYGHAEDLLVGALNGDKLAEQKFRDYDDLTEEIVSRKVYSAYDDDQFNAQRDREFFKNGIDLIEETKAFKKLTHKK